MPPRQRLTAVTEKNFAALALEVFSPGSRSRAAGYLHAPAPELRETRPGAAGDNICRLAIAELLLAA